MGGSLLELIESHRSVDSISSFAARLGIARPTVYRWRTALPDAATLHSIADALDEPYAVVLRAALRGSGYTTTDTDLAAGLTINVISFTHSDCDSEDCTYGDCDSEERSHPAAYTDPQQANDYVQRAAAHGETVETRTVTIDSTALPAAPTHFVAVAEFLSNESSPATGTVRTSAHYEILATFPAYTDDDLAAHGAIAPVRALITGNGYVASITAVGYDDDIVTRAVNAATTLLRDNLPPAGTVWSAMFDLPEPPATLPDVVSISDTAFRGLLHGAVDSQHLLTRNEIDTAAAAYRLAREIVNTALSAATEHSADEHA